MTKQSQYEENNLLIMLAYFNAWNNHDLRALSELISTDIILEDWEIKADGRDEFLSANENIFLEKKGINAKLVNTFVNHQETIAILEITIPEEDKKIPVIDHFKIISGKIIRINAYRGF